MNHKESLLRNLQNIIKIYRFKLLRRRVLPASGFHALLLYVSKCELVKTLQELNYLPETETKMQLTARKFETAELIFFYSFKQFTRQ